MFLHEVSKICKYGNNCERNYCMLQHEANGDDEGENVKPFDAIGGGRK